MVLDPLVQLVQTLAQRIERHRQALSQSEALTRYVLIDPLLRALGWDTEDPEQVQPEYSAGGGAADYALLEQGKPQVLVEAKKLGISPEGGLDQIIKYWWNSSARYLATTNGKEWVVYDSKASGDRVVARFDIGDKDVVATATKALFLWRGNYRQVVVPAPPPLPPAIVPQPTPAPQPQPPIQPTPLPPVPVPKPTLIRAAHTLADLAPAAGSKPPTIIAPDGSQLLGSNWAELMAKIVDWLAQRGKLTQSNCPVGRQGATRYIVAIQPVHPNGKGFTQPRQIGPFYVVETNQNTRQKVGDMLFLLKAVGEDPAKWLVQ